MINTNYDHLFRLLYVLYLEGYHLYKFYNGCDIDSELQKIASYYGRETNKNDNFSLTKDEIITKNMGFYGDVLVSLMQEKKMKIAKSGSIIYPSEMIPLKLFLQDKAEALAANRFITVNYPIDIDSQEFKVIILGNL